MHVIGVLALQGAFAKHVEMLRSLGAEAIEVRSIVDLERCDALIIPGGESTAIMRLLKEGDFAQSLAAYGETHPVFGTCAGLILMAKQIIAEPTKPFGWLGVAVERNAYGRQAESFRANVDLELESQGSSFPALFIRAPRIRQCSADVEVLAHFNEEPVLVRQGQYLGSTFHPELTNNSSIHEYFLKLVKNHKS
ncbi:MAG: pyridoxal 5'-phosphate synthase glutaminase subunit PdxT [Parachlamydia sp.]|nr:pyridoxal 5'-phosphate synthase glutaminase subunit PdxT [Parachlamydia sp.]